MDDSSSMKGIQPSGGRVLVVDDHDLVRKMVVTMLRGEGFDVRSAANGAEAIDVVSSDSLICCVLQDLSMPHMTGDEVIAQLNRIRPDLPILIYSAEDEGVVAHRLSTLDVAGYVQKPFDPEVLVVRLRQLMRH